MTLLNVIRLKPPEVSILMITNTKLSTDTDWLISLTSSIQQPSPVLIYFLHDEVNTVAYRKIQYTRSSLKDPK